MSNLTRLEAVSASLDTAINKANALPDAGSGSGGTSGGSIETCTVNIVCADTDYSVSNVSISTTNQGEGFIYGNVFYPDMPYSPSLTIPNVVCGSVIAVSYTSFGNYQYTHDGDFSNYTFVTFDNGGIAFTVGAPQTSGTYTLTICT